MPSGFATVTNTPKTHEKWYSRPITSLNLVVGRWRAIPSSRTSCIAKGARTPRAKIFTKLIREITTAARLGAADPDANPRLRAAMIAARENNMTRDTIDRAIKRGSGCDADANYEEVRYEGYGPGGVALIVEALTNNRNRTAGEVRSSFSKFGGKLGETNSVSFMFDRMGEFRFPLAAGTADDMLEKAIEAGADDVSSGEGQEGAHEIYCAQEDFNAVREALEKSLGQPPVGQADVAAQDDHPVEGETAQTCSS